MNFGVSAVEVQVRLGLDAYRLRLYFKEFKGPDDLSSNTSQGMLATYGLCPKKLADSAGQCSLRHLIFIQCLFPPHPIITEYAIDDAYSLYLWIYLSRARYVGILSMHAASHRLLQCHLGYTVRSQRNRVRFE